MGKVYAIGSVAEETGYSRETIRLLEIRGVVRPERDTTGRRVFTESDMEKIREYRSRHRRAPAASR
jgi:DNA-binding transcriptional MerR regulator